MSRATAKAKARKHAAEQSPAASAPAATVKPDVKDLFRRAPLVYRPFPVDALAEPLRSLCIHGAKSIGIDEAYIALPGLAHAAGMVNSARYVQTKGDWREPCTLWTLTVGGSGTGKTLGFRLSHKPVAALHFELLDGAKRNSDPCEAMVTHVNIASVKKVIRRRTRGTLLSKNELSPFLAMISKKATGLVAEEVGEWCELDEGGTIINRRILDEDANMDVQNACVSISGTIQPGVLYMSTRGQVSESGATWRFQFAAPPRRLKKINKETCIPTEVLADWDCCLRKLFFLHGTAVVEFSPEADKLWWQWQERIAQQVFEARTEAMAAAYSKIEGRCARYALLDFLMGCPAEEDGRGLISEDSMRRAIELCDWFCHEVERLLSMRDDSEDQRHLRLIVDRVANRPHRRISLRDLQLQEHLKTIEMATILAEAIVAAGFGEIVPGKRIDSRYLVIKEEPLVEAPDTESEGEEDLVDLVASEAASAEQRGNQLFETDAPEATLTAETPLPAAAEIPAADTNPLPDAHLDLAARLRSLQSMPIEQLDLPAALRIRLLGRGQRTVGDLLSLQHDAELDLDRAVAGLLDAPLAEGRLVQAAMIAALSPKPNRCGGCTRHIGFDVNEGSRGLCLDCQAAARPQASDDWQLFGIGDLNGRIPLICCDLLQRQDVRTLGELHQALEADRLAGFKPREFEMFRAVIEDARSPRTIPFSPPIDTGELRPSVNGQPKRTRRARAQAQG